MAQRANSAWHSSRGWQQEDGGTRRHAVEALLRERRHTLQARPAHGAGADSADAACEDEEEMVWLAVLDRSHEIQVQMDAALSRLAAGRYGLCADCEGPIPPARLRALPFAVRCLPCQERREREATVQAPGPTARPTREDGFGIGRRPDGLPRMASARRRPAA